MKPYTAILDYGVGNLKSVGNAMRYLGLPARVTGDARELERAGAVILPGVGAFPNAAARLRRSGLDRALLSLAGKTPILGICLGMQLLFDRGEEGAPCAGIGLIPGSVEKIKTDRKLPHVGWNSLTFPRSSALFRGLPSGVHVYFVHSFCAMTRCPDDVAAVTEYGVPITAAVERGGVYGCQFHPEKSGEAGLLILKNFGELI